MDRRLAGAMAGIGSAVLFGVSAPLSKRLLAETDPWMLAGLMYVGAGGGLALYGAARGVWGAGVTQDPVLGRGDWVRLIAIAVIGGGAGPVLLMFGLARLSGVAGALLLNLEAVFTALLAIAVFGERVIRIELAAILVVLAGAVAVTVTGGPFQADWLGAGAVAGACLAWGVDNNLTARLSRRNPVNLVRFKALTAGAGNVALATAAGHAWPVARVVGISLAVGFVSYGLSVVLDVYALRFVGAARESAYFATAPFAGALAAAPLLGERIAGHDVAGGCLMAVGVAMLIAARRRGDDGADMAGAQAP